MDADEFDALTHSLNPDRSRRAVLAFPFGGLLVALAAPLLSDSAAARRRGRKKNKKRTKCKGGKQKCGGTCRTACPEGRVRNPLTCGCCIVNGGDCTGDLADECCSGQCFPSSETTSICGGITPGNPCRFDAQCVEDSTCDGVCSN